VEDLVATPAPPRQRWSREQQAVVAACVAVGALVRCWALDRSLLTFDETFTANIARLAPGDIPAALRSSDSHPPLDYLLRHLVVGPQSTFWLRFPSAVIGVLTLGVVLWWMWNRGWFGVLVVAFTCFAAIEVLYSRQARMYAIVILAGTVVAAVTERWLERPRSRWAVVAAAALFVGSLAHTSVLLLAMGALFVPGRRTDRPAWVWRAAAAVAVLAWLVVWGPSFLREREVERASWIPFTSFRTAAEAIAGQVSLYNGLAVLIALAVVAGGVVLVRDRPRLGRVWLCLFAAPAAVEILLGLRAHLLLPRSLAFAAWAPVVALAALAAACVDGDPWPTGLSSSAAVRGAGLVAVVLLAVPSVGAAFSYEEDSAPARRALVERAQPGDAVVVHPRFLGPMLRWDNGVTDDQPVAGFADVDAWSALVPGAPPTGRAWVLVPDTYSFHPPPSYVACDGVTAAVEGHYSVSCLERTSS
jgi:hypothetical protein